MKILHIPQSGKRGLVVSQGGRYGQISRALVIPANPCLYVNGRGTIPQSLFGKRSSRRKEALINDGAIDFWRILSLLTSAATMHNIIKTPSQTYWSIIPAKQ